MDLIKRLKAPGDHFNPGKAFRNGVMVSNSTLIKP